MTQSRLTMLKSVQALAEMQEFLLLMKGGGERGAASHSCCSPPTLTS